ncbi:MAG: hypothetical protein K2X50_03535 [Gammaproteobacteria bacterium]|nr:hypothetical protein [Gammaproteobacteria bacterium]
MQENQVTDKPCIFTIKINKSWDECLEVPPEQSLSPGLFNVEFAQPLDADNFYKHLQQALPITGLEYPHLNSNVVTLTNEQFYCLQISMMQKKGEFGLAFLGNQYLMKTLRADGHDFTHPFKLGLIPGKEGRRFNNLRPIERREYVITPDGHLTTRAEKKPQYTPDQKKEFSQIQSNTFLDEKLLAEAFGFSKERNCKLYGLLTHMNDALINRLLIRDSGTVGRPFEFRNSEDAVRSRMIENEPMRALSYPNAKLEDFKKHNLAARSSHRGTNEVLARIRFNPYRSLIVICSDTLETRLLAYYFAQELLQEFRTYAQTKGLSLNPVFRIPIVYYLPVKYFLPGGYLSYRPRMKFYSEDMRSRGVMECSRLYKNISLRNQKFANQDYELLLGLPKITSSMLLDETTPSGKPLALEMIAKCRTRMLSRVLRPVQNPADNSLADSVFDTMLQRNKIKNNDPIIANLIVVEEFTLARKVMEETDSKINALTFECTCSFTCNYSSSLDRKLQYSGNPRQLEFFGLESILGDDAAFCTWTSKKLCLKELPSATKKFLGQLLFNACNRSVFKEYPEIKLLLERGADTTFEKDRATAIVCATDYQDWIAVRMFAHYRTDQEDKSHYGYALLGALKDQQRDLAALLLKAGAKAHWRKVNSGFELESTLFYAVLNEYNDLLPDLVSHEMSCVDGFESRAIIAQDLAVTLGNVRAVEILNEALGVHAVTRALTDEQTLCRYLFEALAVGGVSFFNLRLQFYSRDSVDLHVMAQPQVVFNREKTQGVLPIIKNHLDILLEMHLSVIYIEKIISELMRLVVEFEDIALFNLILKFSMQVSNSSLITVFTTIVNMTHADNFVFNKRLINVIFENCDYKLCREKFDAAFYKKIIAKDFSKATFFIKLGARPFCGESKNNSRESRQSLYGEIAKSGDQVAICILLVNPSIEQFIKDELVSYVVQHSKKYDIKALIAYCSIKITPCLFEAAHLDRDEKAVESMFEVIITYDDYKKEFSSAFLQTWAYRHYFSSGFIDRFVKQCGTAYIRHLSLMCMLDYMEAATDSMNWKELELMYTNIFKRNVRIAQWDGYALDNRGIINPHYGVIKFQYYQTILKALNDYFSDYETLPRPEDSKRTFDEILHEFEKMINASKALTFFSSTNESRAFNQRMYNFLSATDQILSNYEPKSIDSDHGSVKTVEPEALDYLPLSPNLGTLFIY